MVLRQEEVGVADGIMRAIFDVNVRLRSIDASDALYPAVGAIVKVDSRFRATDAGCAVEGEILKSIILGWRSAPPGRHRICR